MAKVQHKYSIGFLPTKWQQVAYNDEHMRKELILEMFVRFHYNKYFQTEKCKSKYMIGAIYKIDNQGIHMWTDYGIYFSDWNRITHVYKEKITGKLKPSHLKYLGNNSMLPYIHSTMLRVHKMTQVKNPDISIKQKLLDTRNDYAHKLTYKSAKKSVIVEADIVSNNVVISGKHIKKDILFPFTKWGAYNTLYNKIIRSLEK